MSESGILEFIMDSKLINTLILQKLSAFVITLAAFIYFKPGYNFMMLAIVLGQSHFMLAYFYKLVSRKIRLKNFLIFVAVSAGIFAYFYRINFPDFRLESLLLVTTLYAIYHVAADDQFTLNFFSPNYSKVQKLQIFSLMSALTGLHLRWQFAFEYSWVFFLVSFVFLLLIAREKETGRQSWASPDYFFLFLVTASFLIYFSGVQFIAQHLLVLTFMGIYHYLVYYFHYFLKIKSIEPKAKSILHKRVGYLSVVALSNVLIVGLFLTMRATQQPILIHLFSYNLFLILTLMHFISSTRTYELPSLFGLKKN